MSEKYSRFFENFKKMLNSLAWMNLEVVQG